MEILHTLAQKRLTEHREYLLTPDSLIIREKQGSNHYERTIRLDDVSFRTEIFPGPLLVGKALSGFVAFVIITALMSQIMGYEYWGFFLGILVGYGIFAYSRSNKSVLSLDAKPDPVVFYRNQPTPQAVDEFVAAVLAQARAHLRWKYGQVDPGYPTEIQVKNFRWLRDQKHITEDEYAALKAALFKPKEGGATPP